MATLRQHAAGYPVAPITTEEVGAMPSVETTPPAYSDRREGLQKAAEMVIVSLPVVGGALQIAFQVPWVAAWSHGASSG